ncbi:MAG: exodeoxyribonuclease V subunit gamma [Betaproteobacteria bacterium]
MLHLFTSNRYELLRERLLADLAEAPGGPFAAQQIIIPSLAIRRDLQLALAKRDGICAQVEFSFLAQWLWDRIAQLVPVQAVSPFAPSRSCWRLYRLFDEKPFIDGLPRLSHYLAEADARMRFELANRVAALFEQYITYRPDWLAAWSEGKPASLPGASPQQRADEAWQAALWRRFTAELGTDRQHPSAGFFAAIERLGPQAIEAAGLPERAHIFALSTLPPLYLDLLQRLAGWIDIRLYLINPCQAYWHEIVEARRLARLQAEGRGSYHEPGHPLLAAWGKQTQALFGLLLDKVEALEDSAFSPNGEAIAEPSLLHRLQDGILDLEPPERGQLPLSPDDHSIECHACHSLTRELEVLHDQLLDLFEGEGAPGPSEVLVATPDLDAAAPLIDAVFGTAGRIPYLITGRGETHTNPVAGALLAVLAAADSRWSASTIFGVLRLPPVAAAFGLDEVDLEALQTALAEAGVHWGRDGRHRAAFDQPDDERHTWRNALARLLLGYAMPESIMLGSEQAAIPTVFRGIAPAGGLEGSAALPLGQLWRFIGTLETLSGRLAQTLTPAEWLALWQGVLNDFIAADPDTAEDRRNVQNTCALLARNMTEAGAEQRLPFAVAQAALIEALDAGTRGGVPSGAVTFTALSSLRQLPYRVVCLVGMSDGAFPSNAPPTEFDLMPLVARPGDRQRRADERNLFLDLILAARERLIITWTGRSQRDNSPLPPAVPVAELIDFLLAATGAPRARLVLEHPLQPFSPAYFSDAERCDPRLFSYDAALCAALQATAPLGESSWSLSDDEDEAPQALPAAPLFTEPLPPVSEEWRTLTPARLIDFYRHPARFLLRQRLDLRLLAGDETLDDEEPLLPGNEEKWALTDRLLPAALAGETDLVALAGAGPELPAGRIGVHYAEREAQAVATFARQLAPQMAEPTLDPISLDYAFEFAGQRWLLAGELGDVRPSGLLRWRCAPAGVRDFLGAWIEHLCLNLAAPPGVVPETRIVARDATLRLRAVAEPREHLAALIEGYRAGLRAPLPFYPRTAWKRLTESASKTHAAWQYESADPWWRLALRGIPEPLGTEFGQLAATLLQPLLAHLEEVAA